MAISLLLHSLPLLALIGWRATPQEAPKPIPVEFVLEKPPPVAAKPPPPPPLPIRGASADTAETAAPKPKAGAARAAHAAAPAKPAEPRIADAESQPEPPGPKLVAPPKPEPPTEQPQAEDLPPPRDSEVALPPPAAPPKPVERKRDASAPVRITSSWPLPLHREHAEPHPPRHLATLVGPPAVRDEYCVRALNMTLAHRSLVPASFLNGRRGKTVLSIRILGDGTLNSVKIRQSSGYPDIDRRIAQMVFAVGAFPPLPPRLPGPWMDFTFMLVFPDGLQR